MCSNIQLFKLTNYVCAHPPSFYCQMYVPLVVIKSIQCNFECLTITFIITEIEGQSSFTEGQW